MLSGAGARWHRHAFDVSAAGSAGGDSPDGAGGLGIKASALVSLRIAGFRSHAFASLHLHSFTLAPFVRGGLLSFQCIFVGRQAPLVRCSGFRFVLVRLSSEKEIATFCKGHCLILRLKHSRSGELQAEAVC